MVKPATFAMSIQRFVLALVLSFCITCALAAVFIFAPLIPFLAKSISGNAETAGIAAVGGGISEWAFLITDLIVFGILLVILSRRRAV